MAKQSCGGEAGPRPSWEVRPQVRIRPSDHQAGPRPSWKVSLQVRVCAMAGTNMAVAELDTGTVTAQFRQPLKAQS